MKTAFLFAGQGAQAKGMGEDFYASYPEVKEIYDRFPEVRDLCFLDQDNVINETAYAQKAMLLTGYAIASLIRAHGLEPEYVCGLSLGEYTALAFSDVWNLYDAIDIVKHRGEIMQHALPLGTTKMAAVIGAKREDIEACLKEVKSGVVEIANYNCPGQIVITGENKAVEDASLLLKDKARRVIPLNVSGAFHSSLLTDASKELRKVLDKYQPQTPKYKVIYNVSGKEETRNINDILEAQICHSVHFEETLKLLIASGVDTFVEIGPGRTLSGFMRHTDPTKKCYNVSDVKGFAALLQALGLK